MYTNEIIQTCFSDLIGWNNHFDADDIPAIAPSLNSSESGLFYNELHPAMRLDLIKAMIPRNRTLSDYLAEKVTAGVTEMIANISAVRRYDQYARRTVNSHLLIDGVAFFRDQVISQNRFVGFAIKPSTSLGLVGVIKKVALQLSVAQEINLYLFHSSKSEALETIPLNVSSANSYIWTDLELKLNSMDDDVQGGVYYLGYYQEDLIGNAIEYRNLDFETGPCGTCDGGTAFTMWKERRKFYWIYPFYVANANLGATPTDRFLNEDIVYEKLTNWGLNLKISFECDLSYFMCEHKFSMVKILGLFVVYGILKDFKYSQEINFMEKNLKSMIIRDLEGDKDTNYINIVDQIQMEVKAVEFDHSGHSTYCLPCAKTGGVNLKTVMK